MAGLSAALVGWWSHGLVGGGLAWLGVVVSLGWGVGGLVGMNLTINPNPNMTSPDRVVV